MFIWKLLIYYPHFNYIFDVFLFASFSSILVWCCFCFHFLLIWVFFCQPIFYFPSWGVGLAPLSGLCLSSSSRLFGQVGIASPSGASWSLGALLIRAWGSKRPTSATWAYSLVISVNGLAILILKLIDCPADWAAHPDFSWFSSSAALSSHILPGAFQVMLETSFTSLVQFGCSFEKFYCWGLRRLEYRSFDWLLHRGFGLRPCQMVSNLLMLGFKGCHRGSGKCTQNHSKVGWRWNWNPLRSYACVYWKITIGGWYLLESGLGMLNLIPEIQSWTLIVSCSDHRAHLKYIQILIESLAPRKPAAAQISASDSTRHHRILPEAGRQPRSLGNIFCTHLDAIWAFCSFVPESSFPSSNSLWNFWFGSDSGFDFGFGSKSSSLTAKCLKSLSHDCRFAMLSPPFECHLRELCLIEVENTLVMLHWMHLNSLSCHLWRTYSDSAAQN